MSDSLNKGFLYLVSIGISCIAIQLIPISRQAAYWNQCLDSTISWINQTSNFSKWEKKAQESLAVGVCNGAVYEPKLKYD